MNYEHITGSTVNFSDAVTGIIAKAILNDNVPSRIFIFELDKFCFFQDNAQGYLLNDIQKIKDWCLGIGYEAKVSYYDKPMIGEQTTTDCDIPTFMLTNPSIQIEITKK